MCADAINIWTEEAEGSVKELQKEEEEEKEGKVRGCVVRGGWGL